MSGIKQKLRAGEVVYGLEFVICDMEHGRCDIGLLSEMIVSCEGTGLAPIARTPDLNAFPLSRILDLGAKGVMIPRVETGEQMQDAIAQLKYTPRGRRGGAGTAEKRFHDNALGIHDALQKAGVRHTFWESPGSAHEFQT